ncbi:16S rRNA (adenine(1518)-N(6)/adenine(1519)-N(6))-dimethyltransferaseRsmA [soil metagenome]
MKHVARKRFGQNFLVDQGVVDAIALAVAPQQGQVVVEIGPGLGALTDALIDRMPASSLPLSVIELDRDLVARLEQRYDAGTVEIHSGDVLDFDFAALATRRGKLRIVGNLPYNISTPLLFRLVDVADAIVDQHFMLQREVVQRMVAAPGESDYSRLSVMLQYRYTMESVLDVGPESFDPQPKVHSAVVRMTPRDPALMQVRDERLFAELVSAGFSQRRKMLRNTLARFVVEIGAEAVESCGVPLQARAEDISPESWERLANLIDSTRSPT